MGRAKSATHRARARERGSKMAPPKLQVQHNGVVMDASRWITFYPAYIDKDRSESKGRRVSKALAVENPNVIEINDSCKQLKFVCVIEDKRHPGDFFRRGRVRVWFRNEDGTPKNPDITTRKKLIAEVAKLVPNHLLRQKAREQALQQQLASSSKAK